MRVTLFPDFGFLSFLHVHPQKAQFPRPTAPFKFYGTGSSLSPNVDTESVPSRVAPLGPRRRPLALRENGSNAHVADPSPLDDFQPTISSTIASLDPKPQYKEFDLKNDDFNVLQELGQGNGGSMMRVQHVPTGTVMAKKVCVSEYACLLRW